MPAVVTPGKQRKSLAKLQRIAKGESDASQLKYQLWQSRATPPADRTSLAAEHSTDAQSASRVTNGSSAGPDQTNEANGGAEGQQQFMSRNGHTRQSLSLLLGEDQSSFVSDWQQQSEPARQYAFSSTRELPEAQSQQAFHQTPALLQRPKRPPAPEPGSSTVSGQDTAYPMSWADRKDERKVPCYLWHESGLPKRVNLRDFPTQTSDDADEAVSSSDTPSTIADSGAAFSQDGSSSAAAPSAAGRAIHKVWEPVRQVLLRAWRLLPYWFRKTLMRSQQPHVPPVHASKVLAQHAMSYHQREPVEGSTYDLTTGDYISASYPHQVALQDGSSIVHKIGCLVAAPQPDLTCCVKIIAWCCCSINCLFPHSFIHSFHMCLPVGLGVYSCALQVVFGLQPPAGIAIEAHVHEPTSPLPEPPCCLPPASAPCVLLHMLATACASACACLQGGRLPP